MRLFLISCFLFCAISLPIHSELSDADLDKIKLIVKDAVEPIKKDIATLKESTKNLESRTDSNFTLFIVLMAFIGAGLAIPISLIAWYSHKDRQDIKKAEDAVRQIETFKSEIRELIKENNSNPIR